MARSQGGERRRLDWMSEDDYAALLEIFGESAYASESDINRFLLARFRKAGFIEPECRYPRRIELTSDAIDVIDYRRAYRSE